MKTRWLFIIPFAIFSLTSIALTKQDNVWIKAVKKEYGDRAARRVNAWRELISELDGKKEKEQLAEVNQFFNQLYFVNDIDLWGKADYWATPLEFLGSNAGDCEDFTIAKYFSLLELGVPDKKLRLIYLKALELDQFHMVLAYYPTPSSVPLILDNIDKEIKPATERTDLLPIYSFNGQHLWLMKGKGNGQQAGESSRLSLWNDLRARNEGLRLNHPIINYDE
ncbi:transglutaminase-like cysteine peptidase [Aliivibrio finisterrensis]|uniref:transglutaminase-like cysteine peptidase n=1 Tax=Aliivibrio finisterrensis TaxID=511998 RepID=UPI001021F5F6|nr:transglutaminase-like cysteine peptidase [Aliivibrio finisterrensis]RYU88495.1 sulfate adenylyltransferase [Aliivibrio finisterrensis]